MTKFLTATALVLLLAPSADAARLCNLTDLLYGTCERGGGFERGERGGFERGNRSTPDPTPDPEPETPKGDNGNHYGNDRPDNNPKDSKNKHDGGDKPGKGNGKK